jgi:RNAse (barnase) inhibitor barstar
MKTVVGVFYMRKKKEKIIDYELIKMLNDYKDRGLSYIDALVDIQENYEVDADDLVDVLPDEIIEDIKIEFANKKMIRNKKLRDTADMKKGIENLLDWLK